ncbi:MAG: NAD(P)H-dependent oxidoreductase [Beijerinckiaceae bacterium]
MTTPNILVFSGSARAGSLNGKLADLAAAELSKLEAKVKRISLKDFPLPVYDGDFEREHGAPPEALAFRSELDSHHGIFIACPEYNSGYAPMLKNTLDWASRGLSRPLLAGKILSLGSASPSWRGGWRGLIQIQTALTVGMGATVLPDMVPVPHADKAFAADGSLSEAAPAKMLQAAVTRLVRAATQAAS